MQKPEVRIIEPQQEETKEVSVSQSEKDYLLSKYGYQSQTFTEPSNVKNSPYDNLTYDEFVELNDREYRERQLAEQRRRSTPKAYTFDNVNYHESKYSNLDLDGQNLGIQVQITSDMPINNNRGW
jgi:hypothetical protein